MILKNLKIFSQNVQKNNFLINTVLEVNQSFNIIFIQEPFVKIIDSGLYLFLFSLFYFIFSLPFNFYFLFLEQLRLGVISHAVTSVTS